MVQTIKLADYENVYADCPAGHHNVYNRVTDLLTVQPISTPKSVKCEVDNCQINFTINKDSVRSLKYRWLFDRRRQLFLEKRYADCILAVCQGAEAFFYQAIINKAVDRNPSYRDAQGDIDLIASNQARINYRIENMPMHEATFAPLRRHFIELYKDDCLQNPYDTSRHRKSDKRQWSFDTIKYSDLGQKRNHVIHKYAYRPTKSEVESYDDFITAITWLEKYLNIRDSGRAIGETM